MHYHDGGGVLRFGTHLRYELMANTLPKVHFPGAAVSEEHECPAVCFSSNHPSQTEYAAVSFLYTAHRVVPSSTYTLIWRLGVSYAYTEMLACDILRCDGRILARVDSFSLKFLQDDLGRLLAAAGAAGGQGQL